MVRHIVVGDLRVQRIERKGGWRSWTIVWPEGTLHAEADRFLRVHDGSGTQKTYAYYLVDHLRWLERECLAFDTVQLRDLERYMGIVGAEVHMPLGEPWRVGKRPYGRSALSIAASCLKGFYLHQASLGINVDVGEKLDGTRLPSRVDRRRSFLGHVKSVMPANPLAPKGPHRRHPKMLPDGAREKLLATVNSARDRMVVTWLADGGLRIGELCGLHLVDLHLRENAACNECRSPHLHVCHRPGNPNRAEAKTKHSWQVEHGTVTGGLIKRVSPEMVHTYFEYLTSEYPRGAGHGMLLVQLHGARVGQPWAPVGARRMLGRAGKRAGLGLVKPHAFRHTFTSAVLDAAEGNLLIARDAGGWASAATVDEVYGHVDLQDPTFDAALRTVWGEPNLGQGPSAARRQYLAPHAARRRVRGRARPHSRCAPIALPRR
ncbi:tyrosine-type recombinase/integrase [Streptomyces phaeochromogenes]